MMASKIVKDIEWVWVKALTTVEHDGERFAAGALFEIEKLAGEALKKLGAVEAAQAPAAASAKTAS